MQNIIQMILKDNEARTEIQTAYALQTMQKEDKDVFGDKMKYKPFKYFGSERVSLEYKGHFCGSHDALVIPMLDKSGVLKKNVAAFYVLNLENFGTNYYDVGRLEKKYEEERTERKVSSAMENMF